MTDPIDPPHYQRTTIQPRQIVYDWFGLPAIAGQVVKYIYRAVTGHKEGASALEDLRKARAWLDYGIERLAAEQEEGTP